MAGGESMKYKVGDKVRIKSLAWYNENNVNENDILENIGTFPFFPYMTRFCGQVLTIKDIHITYYTMEETDYYVCWTDEMIEGLVEEETYDFLETDIYKPDKKPSLNDFMDILNNEVKLPDGYIFKDENGNVINATKIVLEKKKKEYPKTFDKCCHILQTTFLCDVRLHKVKYYDIFYALAKLIVCRDAYWKLYGEEMGLGKPWEPDYDSGVEKFGIIYLDGAVQESNPTTNWERHLNKILDFPTREMRDAFYENFKEEIEECKELL